MLFLFLRMRLHLLLVPGCLRPISRLPLKCSWPFSGGHGGVTAIRVRERCGVVLRLLHVLALHRSRRQVLFVCELPFLRLGVATVPPAPPL